MGSSRPPEGEYLTTMQDKSHMRHRIEAPAAKRHREPTKNATGQKQIKTHNQQIKKCRAGRPQGTS
eukprot:7934335-Karenia_brevis.AAC.1